MASPLLGALAPTSRTPSTFDLAAHASANNGAHHAPHHAMPADATSRARDAAHPAGGARRGATKFTMAGRPLLTTGQTLTAAAAVLSNANAEIDPPPVDAQAAPSAPAVPSAAAPPLSFHDAAVLSMLKALPSSCAAEARTTRTTSIAFATPPLR